MRSASNFLWRGLSSPLIKSKLGIFLKIHFSLLSSYTIPLSGSLGCPYLFELLLRA
ncbi:hypothetical protein PROVRUST_04596 [Providencia rustigianii DSM 4541]|uniref:Uncharacterized protein n=1 Tax=Providencia rustigianii DSM 4541 TaxID=500637 RepID=D1NXG7_9GAMM|nr:hypothetical protein PROVRUST_04596 [Providencia rustigianii DSM 4541]